MQEGFLLFGSEKVVSNNEFDPKYFNELAKVEGKNWWFRSRNKLILWVLQSYFPQSKNFLEIGCGTGFVLLAIQQAFPGLVLCGVEFLGEGLAYASKRLPGVTLFQMDARRIPFENEFDVIGAFDVLEHIQEDEEALLQMFRAAKSGGGVIVTVPQHPFLWSKVDEYSFHKRRYTRKELVQKVKGIGFKEIWCTSFVFFLLPFMLLSRVRKKVQKKTEFDPLEEFKISESLNQILSKIMDVEHLGVRAGFSLPIGGSLLLIAKKFES